MASDLLEEQRELADFIRAGSRRGPQCFGSYFDKKGAHAHSAPSTKACTICLASTGSSSRRISNGSFDAWTKS